MPTAPLEKEFKFRLTAWELSLLKKQGKVCALNRQTNYYFDIQPALPFSQLGIGIRVRNQNGKFLLTVKIPTGGMQQRGFHVKQEWESPLSEATAKEVIRRQRALITLRSRPIQALKKRGTGLPLQEIRKIGSMKNIRFRVEYPGGLSLELDHFVIRGKHFYEAECETTSPTSTLKAIRALWQGLKIPLRPETKTKLARFLSGLRK